MFSPERVMVIYRAVHNFYYGSYDLSKYGFSHSMSTNSLTPSQSRACRKIYDSIGTEEECVSFLGSACFYQKGVLEDISSNQGELTAKWRHAKSMLMGCNHLVKSEFKDLIAQHPFEEVIRKPHILYKSETICIESVAILNNTIQWFSFMQVSDRFLYEYFKKIAKYGMFLQPSKESLDILRHDCKTILIELQSNQQ